MNSERVSRREAECGGQQLLPLPPQRQHHLASPAQPSAGALAASQEPSSAQLPTTRRCSPKASWQAGTSKATRTAPWPVGPEGAGRSRAAAEASTRRRSGSARSPPCKTGPSSFNQCFSQVSDLLASASVGCVPQNAVRPVPLRPASACRRRARVLSRRRSPAALQPGGWGNA